MANFATVADVELVIQQEIPSGKLADVEFALMTVSVAIRNYCHQQIDLVEDDVVLLGSVNRRGPIFLPELPVVSVASVIENSVEIATPADYLLGRVGDLHRVGRPWYYGLQTVEVTYTHGYAVIPDIIQAITARAASRLYQAGLRASEAAGVPGVVSKTLGDFSVTYGGESVVEGTMGASGARILLLSEKDFLNEYRL